MLSSSGNTQRTLRSTTKAAGINHQDGKPLWSTVYGTRSMENSIANPRKVARNMTALGVSDLDLFVLAAAEETCEHTHLTIHTSIPSEDIQANNTSKGTFQQTASNTQLEQSWPNPCGDRLLWPNQACFPTWPPQNSRTRARGDGDLSKEATKRQNQQSSTPDKTKGGRSQCDIQDSSWPNPTTPSHAMWPNNTVSKSISLPSVEEVESVVHDAESDSLPLHILNKDIGTTNESAVWVEQMIEDSEFDLPALEHIATRNDGFLMQIQAMQEQLTQVSQMPNKEEHMKEQKGGRQEKEHMIQDNQVTEDGIHPRANISSSYSHGVNDQSPIDLIMELIDIMEEQTRNATYVKERLDMLKSKLMS